MNGWAAFRFVRTALLAGLVAWLATQVNGPLCAQPGDDDNPPVYRGGRWVDHFGTEAFSDREGVEVRGGHLLLKLGEALKWTKPDACPI